MNEKNSCTISDLFELFSDSLEPADVLTSKLMAQISSAITKERLKLRMNQSEFANYINASQSLISRWEHGDYNFSIRKLSEIATKLNLNVDIMITSNLFDEFHSPTSFSQSCTLYYTKNKEVANLKTYTISKSSQEGQKYASIC